jgi:hypothetical protein
VLKEDVTVIEASVERRRERRAELEASVEIRWQDTAGDGNFRREIARNVSLAGVYFETDQITRYAVNDVVTVSVSISDAQSRAFPFTRLAGRGRVVRVKPLDASPHRRVAVAIEFGEDVTVLTGVPVE